MLSIPPPLIAREVSGDARGGKAGACAAVQGDGRPVRAAFLQPIYDLEVPRMAFGRVAILGDAAFVARPHVGAGVAKAAQDALTLAEALAANTDAEAALKQFEHARVVLARASSRGHAISAPTSRPICSRKQSANTPRATARRKRCWQRPQ